MYKRSQAALDFLVSYGIAFLVIAIAIYIIFTSGIFSPSITPTSCTPSPGFECLPSLLSTNGTIIMRILQVTGSTIRINGIACTTLLENATNQIPLYGNINITGPAASPQFYPNGYEIPNGGIEYSDNYTTLEAKCYGGKSSLATGKLGNIFKGYVVLNYTMENSDRPYIKQEVAYLTIKYT
ncbi:hypothetical protein Mia14_0101 [Candidatus Mancarchaeum acidiphilum]|uniref:Uncharacterized protein n=1 Tax=Candidatus Mancarchaeum acidiphilum TaxID=1920749 RepID=A0A218NLT9_9ARCH|nr:hypothetical protein [Candidatus Mancarchaeum acidiphilum]ASI13444.1 hypothetical protein Mia14_0101 [Candidatus Mancarchaeum acidiphilum]